MLHLNRLELFLARALAAQHFLVVGSQELLLDEEALVLIRIGWRVLRERIVLQQRFAQNGRSAFTLFQLQIVERLFCLRRLRWEGKLPQSVQGFRCADAIARLLPQQVGC